MTAQCDWWDGAETIAMWAKYTSVDLFHYLGGGDAPRPVAFARESVSWDPGKKALVLGGAAFALGSTVEVAGGSIDTAEAAADPAFALDGCAPGPLLFVAERMSKAR